MRMVKNEKGFTIIELLAVIVIASIIITPLMYSMVNNITTNQVLQTRRSSVSIAEGAIYGFDKLSYTDLETLQENSATHHIVFDTTTCNLLTLKVNDDAICSIIFDSSHNNNTFDSDHFKAYIYDYNISSSDQTSLTGPSSLIPQEVKDVIGAITPSTDPNPGLLRITIWINYSDDPYSYTVVSGLLIGDWSDSIYGDN